MKYLTRKEPESSESSHETPRLLFESPLEPDLSKNLESLRSLLQDCSDAVIKEFVFGQDVIRGALLYFDGLVDRMEIEENLLRPMLRYAASQNDFLALQQNPQLISDLSQRLLPLSDVKELSFIYEVCDHISAGDTVLLVDGQNRGLYVGTRKWPTRSIPEPQIESVIWGPKEGFNETLRSNTSQLRRRLKSVDFKIVPMKLGRITKTDVVMCYIEHIAPRGLIKEVQRRLESIDIDAVLDTGYLEELISDYKYSILSQVEYTEKPDRITGHLLEGRIAIMVDGSPMAMVVPTGFPQFLNAGEDYYQNFIGASLFRILRFCAFLIALLLPSVFVAVITYHQEMIPLPLYLTLISARQGVPFPAAVEALMLELTFELLREAGLRLPRAIGPAVSIVGALIIGDAAVRAGLVGTPMVVVVAFTGIASFATPSYNSGLIVRIARFGMLLVAATMGFFGIIIGLLIIAIRMTSLTSFGQPYLAPLSPMNWSQISDVLVRRPWSMNVQRPYLEGMNNQARQQVQPKEDAAQNE